MGFGSLALAQLVGRETNAGFHYPGKAKSVIHIFLNERAWKPFKKRDLPSEQILGQVLGLHK